MAEAQELLADAYGTALMLVRTDQTYVESIAATLVKRRALTHPQLVALDSPWGRSGTGEKLGEYASRATQCAGVARVER